METKLELNTKFDLPDGKRNHLKELLFLILVSWLFVVLIVVSVCNADAIDDYCNQAASTLFLYVPGAPILAVIIRIVLFNIGNLMRSDD